MLTFRLETYKKLDSTNKFLLEQEPPIHGRAVLAFEQTEGQGRRGRKWITPQDSLALSLGFEINQKPLLPWFAVWVGIHLYDLVLDHVAPSHQLTLKWPNDLYADGKKLAGILVQAKDRGDTVRCVVGIGMNLRLPPEDLGERASCLRSLGSINYEPEEIAKNLLNRLQRSAFPPGSHLSAHWSRRCKHLGEHVRFGDLQENSATWQMAKALGLGPNAELEVQIDSGEKRLLLSEEVSLLPA